MQARQQLARLVDGAGDEGGVILRIVHVGEHEVLPHEDAELVAQIVEVVALVDHGAADAQNVHAGLSRLRQRRGVRGPIGAERERVERRPAGAATEDGHAVDAQLELVVADDLAQADRTELDSSTDVTDLEAHLVARRLAVRVRPPAHRIRQLETAGEPFAVEREQGPLLLAGAFDDERDRPGGRGAEPAQPTRHFDTTDLALQLRAQPHVVDGDPDAALDDDRPPRPHGRGGR